MLQQDGKPVGEVSRERLAAIRGKNGKPSDRKLLGDRTEQALTMVGITSERVSRWLGRPCGCKERKEKMNALDAWVRRTLKGKTEDAKGYLEKIIGTKGADK